MSDSVYIGKRATNIEVSPQFNGYSKVIIHIDDDTEVVAGDDTGRVLEIDNPFGNQQMADEILTRLRGFQYQPHQVDGALLNPAAEIGDAVETATSCGGLYTRSRKFGRLMKADISAPHDEEINHEYQFESPQERKFKRQVGEVRASLILTSNAITAEVSRATQAEGELSASLSIQASEIAAKVSASGGSNTSGSFSWVLNNSGHRWYANGNSTPIMEVTASGLTVRGKGIFNEGKIGGFDIGSNALSYNGLTWGDTSKNYGAYIGQSGIQLGKNFSVDNAGNVRATNITLSGTLNVGGDTITAEALRSGAQSAYSSGSYWSGGATGGYKFNDATTSQIGAVENFWTDNLRADRVYANSYLYCARFQYGNQVLSLIPKASASYVLGY